MQPQLLRNMWNMTACTLLTAGLMELLQWNCRHSLQHCSLLLLHLFYYRCDVLMPLKSFFDPSRMESEMKENSPKTGNFVLESDSVDKSKDKSRICAATPI